MWSHPRVTRFIGGRAFTETETWTKTLRYVGHWALMGFGYWLVEETATKRFVGDVGLADFKRGFGAEYEGLPEMGWALSPECHGKGYATEAVQAALRWAQENLPHERTICFVATDNPASLRVAEKVGYQEIARLEPDGEPLIAFERSNRP